MRDMHDIRAPYTLEVTGKAIAQIEDAKDAIPAGTPINIAFLGNEHHSQRVNAASVIRAGGFEPVPIISSRRLRSGEDRDQLIDALFAVASPSRVLLVGGDPDLQAGPFENSMELMSTAFLDEYDIQQVGIVAYPEGHPKIETDLLWDSLRWKLGFLQDAGRDVEITTQYALDPESIVEWLKSLRSEGITVPVRIGVPGPAKASTIVGYARQFGVNITDDAAERYGVATVDGDREFDGDRQFGADQFLDDLTAGLNRLSNEDRGDVLFHLYPFGGMADSVRWINRRLAN